ncbi:MAG: hypothetical protein PHU25_15175 [Deltaproteobacteria bacterium]|nr:hypothetical protein [Deltaproteobacteria bacterium]
MTEKKTKCSFTLAPDALEMLTAASETEGISQSEMLERCVRGICIDYSPHIIEVARLENGNATISISRTGRTIYQKRGVARGATAAVDGVISISMNGIFRIDEVSNDLIRIASDPTVKLSIGTPVPTRSGATVTPEVLPLKAKNDNYSRELLLFASKTVGALEITSIRQISGIRCPQCNLFMLSLSVWSPIGEAEEREWRCFLGHVTNLGETRPRR